MFTLFRLGLMILGAWKGIELFEKHKRGNDVFEKWLERWDTSPKPNENVSEEKEKKED